MANEADEANEGGGRLNVRWTLKEVGEGEDNARIGGGCCFHAADERVQRGGVHLRGDVEEGEEEVLANGGGGFFGFKSVRAVGEEDEEGLEDKRDSGLRRTGLTRSVRCLCSCIS